MTDAQVDTAVSFADQIRQAMDSGEIEIPPLPELALRLKQLLEDEDRADAKRVAELVRNEPAVAAGILRFANSAAFGGLRQINELNQAIARLGLKRVGTLVTSLSIKGQFRPDTKEKREILQLLWDHSVATALAARKLADRDGIDLEEAFLSGLLHDCGKLLVLKSVDQLEHERPGTEFTRPVIDELMETLHAELGHKTLVAWNLPEHISAVALKHEDPPEEESNRLLIIVKAADLISRKLGFHLDPDPEIDLLDHEAFDPLEIGDIEMATLMVDLEDEILSVREMF